MARVIIDTNLWISFLIGKNSQSLKDLLIQAENTPIFSAALLEELTAVTQRPKLQKYFSQANVETLLSFLKSISEIIEPTSQVKLCRDPKADFLITGDQDLLVLKEIEMTKIVTYQQFVALQRDL
ncbi:putative toxin-antitoxin system toxin component, PIN family [[Limnothrix rosea] IAM M-220]|uniref:putative toxin-antitoxin system toxin component, PIN family n=1 Tax=[Limnothrix rosea] IAM M-220 TaxID=454133 RepID=UPI0009648986|nr:putative toxin-antitoxin system toxin component, PIN family [[Limnothrix rosea] IAM M-220]OKH19059.1 putative toxin-antitoxin system toxin component, PIN family [[Limnothrix rosea] IAM M-220]